MPRQTLHDIFDEIDRMNAESVRGGEEDDDNPGNDDSSIHPLDAARMSNLVQIEPDLARAKQIQLLGRASAGTSGGGATEDGAVGQGAKTGNIGHSVDVVNDGANLGAGLNVVGLKTTEIIRVNGSDVGSDEMIVTLCPPVLKQKGGAAVVKNFQAVAVVSYGAGGVQSTVELDWLDGASFQVSGSYVSVAVRIDNPGAGPFQGDVWTFGAFIAQGSKSRAARMTRSVRVGAVVHGDAATPYIAIIPNGSTDVQYVYTPAETVKNVVLKIQDSAGVTMFDRLLSDNQGVLPIAGRATPAAIARVLNSDAAVDIVDSWLVFTVEP